MNKSELVEAVADKAGLSKADAERALNAMIDVVQGAVASDDKVTVPGFGSWSALIGRRASSTGRSPRASTPAAEADAGSAWWWPAWCAR